MRAWVFSGLRTGTVGLSDGAAVGIITPDEIGLTYKACSLKFPIQLTLGWIKSINLEVPEVHFNYVLCQSINAQCGVLLEQWRLGL